jgi:hypothetical protein
VLSRYQARLAQGNLDDDRWKRMKTRKTVQAAKAQVVEHNHIAQAARAEPVSQLANPTALAATENSFIDSRPQALVQGRFQQMADQGQHTTRLKTLQTRMDDSPQAWQMQNRAQRMQAALPMTPEPTVRQARSHESANTTGMPDKLKSGIENLSGMAMDDVKVHYNSAQPGNMQAHAFAQGADIHVAPGQEQHLPHEAWHVVQQKQGRVKPSFQMKSGVSINDDVALESEADVMGARALSAGTVQKVAAEEDHEGVFQKMAASSGPVFQLRKKKGKLNAHRTHIIVDGVSYPIPAGNVIPADWAAGKEIDVEMNPFEGMVSIYDLPATPTPTATPTAAPAAAAAADNKPNKPALPPAGAEIKAATATGNAAAGAGAEAKKATPPAATGDKDVKAKVPAATSVGKLSGLAALAAEVDAKGRAPIKPKTIQISQAAIDHVWYRHTPLGIFNAGKVVSATAGSDVAISTHITYAEFSAWLASQTNATRYKWYRRDSDGKMIGTGNGVKMLCNNIDGDTFDLETCFTEKDPVPIGIVNAALKAHPDDYDAFCDAIGR